MKKTALVTLALFTFLSAAASTVVLADSSKQACWADRLRFCREARPGGGEIEGCIRKHEAELSPPCQEARKLVRARAVKYNQVCAANLQKYCPGIFPGKGQQISCLRKHESELSKECRAIFKQAQGDVDRPVE